MISFHPPFSFRSCRKENGPWTVQKKRTLGAELAHKAQVRLKYGSCSKGVPPKLESPTGARRFWPLNRSSPAFTLHRSTLVVVEKPVLLAPLTLHGSASGKRSRECPEDPTHAQSTPRAETFLESDTLSHRESVFSLGPCTARSLFGAPKREWGVHSAGKAGVPRPRAASARSPVPRPWRENSSRRGRRKPCRPTL